MNIEFRDLPAMRLAYLRYTGPYGDAGIGQTWDRFNVWRSARGLMQPPCKTYGISQDDPSVTPAAQCRYDCCVEVGAAFAPSADDAAAGIAVQGFEGGRYACALFAGTANDIKDAWMHLYGVWLPQSGWLPAAKPGLEIYPETYEMDEKTGAFKCWLAVPVLQASV